MLRRNVLIFHSGALGDFVLNWPLAMALGRIYAQSRVMYVTASQKGKLAEKVLRIDSVDVESGWHHLFAADAKPPENVAKLLQGSHAIFSFVAESDSAWAANVRRIAPEAKLLCAPQNPPAKFAGHVSEHLVRSIETDKIAATAVAQMLNSIAQRGTGLARTTGGPIVLHPGAGAPSKCWPRESFIELATRLRATGKQVEFILGDVEQDRWSKQEIASLGGVTIPATLLELQAMLAKASIVVANDSGPAHLAGILGVPTVCLFGPTDPVVWKPLGPHVKTLASARLQDITVDSVMAAIESM